MAEADLRAELEGRNVSSGKDDEFMLHGKVPHGLDNKPEALDPPEDFSRAQSMKPPSGKQIEEVLKHPKVPPAVKEIIERYLDALKSSGQPHHLHFAAFVSHVRGYLGLDPGKPAERPWDDKDRRDPTRRRIQDPAQLKIYDEIMAGQP